MPVCYSKEKLFKVSIPKCYFCNEQIKAGENLYSACITWGNSQFACIARNAMINTLQ